MARARSRYLRTLHNEHTAILDAVNHQDAEAARRATRRHLLSEASRFRDAAAVASLRP
jgi:DNA-binding FadR family transcriptional regulator